MTNNKCELYVNGMHCAACEILIEKKLKEEFGATSVKASLTENKVSFLAGNSIDLNMINKSFKDLGYTFDTKEIKSSSSKNGLLIGVVVFFVFLLFNSFGRGINYSVSGSSSLPAFFLFGVIASLSSCAALVGGLLLTLSKQWAAAEISKRSIYFPHILFNLGRIISFILLGGVLGLLGDVLGLSSGLASVLVLAVSLYMIVVGLQQLNIKQFTKFKITYPKFISAYATSEKNFMGKYLPFFAGVMTFFIPCGFTIVAQGIAISAGSFVNGALIMGAFALGTLPSLALISYGSTTFLQKPKLSSKFGYVAAVIVLFFGLYNFNAQLNVLSLPSFSDISLSGLVAPVKDFINLTSFNQQDVSQTSKLSNGKQLVQIEANGFSYYPRDVEIKSGVPTRLEILNKGAVGCANSLVGRGLFTGVVTLEDGLNVVEFTPKTPGTYKITCSMGMVPPVSVKVI